MHQNMIRRDQDMIRRVFSLPVSLNNRLINMAAATGNSYAAIIRNALRAELLRFEQEVREHGP